MKYKCPDCGEVFYRDVKLVRCPSCNSWLEDKSVQGNKISCPVSGENVKVVNGIPSCEDFKLTNSVGSRCAFGELPSRCESCGLPFYSPRVGVVEESNTP
ncbi:MAG: hypothetical protein ACLFN7_05755 [Candidatus Acetothermia bacterium]